ncbi:MAG TPA: hypothetical protein VEK73_01725 [Xanthobacteraceae bacterium]|nr:hypothetical protein [Xanthobacteraceae bacterium]
MQSQSRRLPAFGLAVAALALALPLSTSAGYGQAGPFAHLAGTWSGDGTITTSSGGSERIRCRARYTIGEGGRLFQQALTCASDSYKFEISCTAEAQGSAVTGTWQEATRGVSGTLSGRVSGQNITGRVEAGGFSAGVAVSTSGRSQAVVIRPQGSDIADVSVRLHK